MRKLNAITHRAIPPTQLGTPRAILRKMELADALQWKRVNNAIAKRMAAEGLYWPPVPSVVYARNEILHYTRMWEEGTRFAYVIVDRASGKVIGDFHLKQVDTRGRRMEFGHALAPSAWGTGITHETIDAVARAARAMGYRLWAKVEVSNIRSWKSLENRGAVFVGTRSFNVHGEKERMRVYELPE